MVAADRAAAGVIDIERERGAGFQRALLDGAGMHEQIAGLFLRIGDAEAQAVGRHGSGIADLSAGLAVERGLVEDDRAGLALAERCHFLAVLTRAATTPSALSVS